MRSRGSASACSRRRQSPRVCAAGLSGPGCRCARPSHAARIVPCLQNDTPFDHWPGWTHHPHVPENQLMTPLASDLSASEQVRGLQEMTFLAEVARLAASARTFAELMGTIIDRARAAARADVCSIYLMDRDGTGVTLAATDGLDQEAVGRARLALGEGLTGLAAR